MEYSKVLPTKAYMALGFDWKHPQPIENWSTKFLMRIFKRHKIKIQLRKFRLLSWNLKHLVNFLSCLFSLDKVALISVFIYEKLSFCLFALSFEFAINFISLLLLFVMKLSCSVSEIVSIFTQWRNIRETWNRTISLFKMRSQSNVY